MTLAELDRAARVPGGVRGIFRDRIPDKWLPHWRGEWKGRAMLIWIPYVDVPWICSLPNGPVAPFGFALADLFADDWELVPHETLVACGWERTL